MFKRKEISKPTPGKGAVKHADVGLHSKGMAFSMLLSPEIVSGPLGIIIQMCTPDIRASLRCVCRKLSEIIIPQWKARLVEDTKPLFTLKMPENEIVTGGGASVEKFMNKPSEKCSKCGTKHGSGIRFAINASGNLRHIVKYVDCRKCLIQTRSAVKFIGGLYLEQEILIGYAWTQKFSFVAPSWGY